eukprot:TRINITY_DN59468_c0_g1_i2.p1 TRINITY_DN59468_c0_g1~~TRINITY_DN59468_c0_g1_i2.p1  ORF type:complete len:305 (+),score=33.14 TRINITY_DN59468_c0_g1_i2:103-1017(+)
MAPLLAREEQRDKDQDAASWQPGGILGLRGADGFARNIIFANQISLFQRHLGCSPNSAQQVAKLLSGVCSFFPTVFGWLVERSSWPLEGAVLFGCFSEIIAIMCIAFSASPLSSTDGPDGRYVLGFGLLILYPIGYGVLTSTLAPLGSSETAAHQRPVFFGSFFAWLAAGGLIGIFFGGLLETQGCDWVAYLTALGVFSAGTCVFKLRRRKVLPRDLEEQLLSSPVSPFAAGRRPAMWPLFALVPFYCTYLQWTTSWYVQAQYMHRGWNGFYVPACYPQGWERMLSLIFLKALPKFFTLVSAPA